MMSITAVGSRERRTAPGMDTRSRLNWKKQSVRAMPARQEASLPSSGEAGLIISPNELNGPIWVGEEIAMIGPSVSTSAMAANTRRVSYDVLSCQCSGSAAEASSSCRTVFRLDASAAQYMAESRRRRAGSTHRGLPLNITTMIMDT